MQKVIKSLRTIFYYLCCKNQTVTRKCKCPKGPIMRALHRAKYTIRLFLQILPGSHHWPNVEFWNIFKTLFISNLPMGHIFEISTEYIKTISQQFDSKKCLVSGLLFFYRPPNIKLLNPKRKSICLICTLYFIRNLSVSKKSYVLKKSKYYDIYLIILEHF